MIYDYRCKCGNVQEEIHGMTENPAILCKKCTCIMQRIVTGGTGVVFKGGDWPSADARFKNSMTKKSAHKGQKAKDHNKPVTTLGDLQ